MKLDLWECIPGRCITPGAEGVPTYVVRVRCRDGSVWEWPDVDVDQGAVFRLVETLQTAQPERCHYEDLVLDFIQRQAEYLPIKNS